MLFVALTNNVLRNVSADHLITILNSVYEFVGRNQCEFAADANNEGESHNPNENHEKDILS